MFFNKKKVQIPLEWKQQENNFIRIMNSCTGFEGNQGGASGVKRLIVREKRSIRPAMPVSQGRISGKEVADSSGGVDIEYDFYLRTSTVGYRANLAINELYRRVASAVCSNKAYRDFARVSDQVTQGNKQVVHSQPGVGWKVGKSSGTATAQRMAGLHRGAPAAPAPIPRLHVPRFFCCIDIDMGESFSKVFQQVQKKVGATGYFTSEEYFIRGMQYQGDVSNPPQRSIAVVEGVRCKALTPYLEHNEPFPQTFNFKGHACALGVLHAIDMVIGNYDRLQARNISNFFVDGYGSMIAIDCDSQLPQKRSEPDTDWEKAVFRKKSDSLGSEIYAFPFIHPVPSIFHPYTVSARSALENDIDEFIKGDNVTYVEQLRINRDFFLMAALMTFKEIKKIGPELANLFPEEVSCSRSTLLAKIKALRGG
ncbi:hypothetical protein [Desulfobotulus mexicanus]|uniref:Uncharacterized protein n=1 Tax=Desulfobotulus mexicanus TaxID=2586642 RepID=A0A5S5ME09_9BACT|nr:hypothetical protein [Desulfobotulus mexicanus]TYT73920.1 hypothetical protein FIM25_12840 [Desulfobotulus mexicanus]